MVHFAGSETDEGLDVAAPIVVEGVLRNSDATGGGDHATEPAGGEQETFAANIGIEGPARLVPQRRPDAPDAGRDADHVRGRGEGDGAATGDPPGSALAKYLHTQDRPPQAERADRAVTAADAGVVGAVGPVRGWKDWLSPAHTSLRPRLERGSDHAEAHLLLLDLHRRPPCVHGPPSAGIGS